MRFLRTAAIVTGLLLLIGLAVIYLSNLRLLRRNFLFHKAHYCSSSSCLEPRPFGHFTRPPRRAGFDSGMMRELTRNRKRP